AARVAGGSEDSVRRRRRWTPERQARLQELARQGLSHAAIARITGLHRVTVSRWLTTEPPSVPTGVRDQDSHDAGMTVDGATTPPAAEQPPSAALAADDVLAAPPPAPWTSWEQVWQVHEALKEHRWLLLRRPDHLTAEQQ